MVLRFPTGEARNASARSGISLRKHRIGTADFAQNADGRDKDNGCGGPHSAVRQKRRSEFEPQRTQSSEFVNRKERRERKDRRGPARKSRCALRCLHAICALNRVQARSYDGYRGTCLRKNGKSPQHHAYTGGNCGRGQPHGEVRPKPHLSARTPGRPAGARARLQFNYTRRGVWSKRLQHGCSTVSSRP
jgi:hypothetical protein